MVVMSSNGTPINISGANLNSALNSGAVRKILFPPLSFSEKIVLSLATATANPIAAATAIEAAAANVSTTATGEHADPPDAI